MSSDEGETGSTIPIRTSDGGKYDVTFGGSQWVEGGIDKWRENPSLMLYKLQANFYKFSWLLIPISIPFVWSLFLWKRQFKAYDHAIFVTYSLGFITLLTLAIVVATLLGMPTVIVVLASLFIPPLHLYKQLRGTYGLSRWKASWRLLVLTIFIIVILAIFSWLLLMVGMF